MKRARGSERDGARKVTDLERGECVRGDVRLAFRLRGRGEPVVFVQGVGVHGDGWNPQIERLADEFACLSFDHRGVGASSKLSPRATLDDLALDVLALFDRVGWSSAHVVGHSLGGLVAQAVALRARARVRSLALLCTFSRGRDIGASLCVWWLGARSRIGSERSRRRAFLEMILPHERWTNHEIDAWRARLEPYFGHDLVHLPHAAAVQLAIAKCADLALRLCELRELPTLVVSGELDLLAPPRLGRAIAASIEGANYVELAGSAHAAPIVDAEVVTAQLREHLLQARRGELPATRND